MSGVAVYVTVIRYSPAAVVLIPAQEMSTLPVWFCFVFKLKRALSVSFAIPTGSKLVFLVSLSTFGTIVTVLLFTTILLVAVSVSEPMVYVAVTV